MPANVVKQTVCQGVKSGKQTIELIMP